MHKIAIPQAAIDRALKRRELLHVFGEIIPSRTAHVVVDLQNGFMAPGQPIEIPAAREIVPNVNRIMLATFADVMTADEVVASLSKATSQAAD
jgi:ureidoacrylate peracid hydrolase